MPGLENVCDTVVAEALGMSSALPSPHPKSHALSELSSLVADIVNVNDAPATILPVGGATEAAVTVRCQRCSSISTTARRRALSAWRRRISFLLNRGVKMEKTPLSEMRMRVPFLQDDRTEIFRFSGRSRRENP